MNYKRITDLPGVRIAREAMVVGDVTIGEDSCVLFYSTVRGDEGTITIGRETNIQESCTIHASIEGDVVIGDNVTIGHQAIIHGCTVGDRTLIGMAATILDGAEIGCDCIVGAGSLVTKHTRVPDGSLVLRIFHLHFHMKSRSVFLIILLITQKQSMLIATILLILDKMPDVVYDTDS